MDRKKVTRVLLIAVGSIAVGLATVGLVVPVLPTTPFLLLACFCFARSSERLHAWIFRNRLFGKHIENYVKHKAVTKGTRLRALIFLWVGLIVSILLVSKLAVTLILLVVGAGVTAHLLLLKTI